MSWRALRAQTLEEIRMTLEQGERLLVTFVIPILGLVLFSSVPIISTGTAHRVDFFAPSVLGLAVISTAMVNLSISTGFERGWGVLKRLGATPLGSSTLLVAKVLAVLAVELVQVVVLGAIAAGLGWHPHAGAGLAVGAELLGTVAFSGIGFLLAGTLRAEVTLALANGLYVVMLGISGIMFPIAKLGGFAAVARLLPSAALTDVLHPSLGGGAVPVEGWVVLAAWAVAAPIVAAAAFRFD
ncbi:MAG: type transporter [Acidimicrobiaceae bacterium]|jgi:ABC-2 type transport system permease protein|nr:type transporter [Acidimicrobiaceae bacterium]